MDDIGITLAVAIEKIAHTYGYKACNEETAACGDTVSPFGAKTTVANGFIAFG